MWQNEKKKKKIITQNVTELNNKTQNVTELKTQVTKLKIWQNLKFDWTKKNSKYDNSKCDKTIKKKNEGGKINMWQNWRKSQCDKTLKTWNVTTQNGTTKKIKMWQNSNNPKCNKTKKIMIWRTKKLKTHYVTTQTQNVTKHKDSKSEIKNQNLKKCDNRKN